MAQRLNNLHILKERRKGLRSNPTDVEIILWSVLKGSKLNGKKFRRQHSIGYYIVDFYCPSEKLVIELDGYHHFTPEGKAKDYERNKFLAELGIKVLRFSNTEVQNNLSNVLKAIKNEFNSH